MPELPEVETIRRDLEKEIVGKKIKAAEASGLRTLRRHKTKKAFTSRVEGRKILGVERKGKYLVLRLEPMAQPGSSEKVAEVLVIHLGMSGQLLLAKSAKDPAPKHTHVTFTLTPAGILRFVDPRTFGEVFVATPAEIEEEVPELAHLGFDPIDDVMSWVEFGERLRSRQKKLKDLLMDQGFIAGLGNIYSDEILWGAGLRYDRVSSSLTAQEIRRLSRAMSEILQEGIKFRGSTLSDNGYVDLHGEPGRYAAEHKVYDREGQPCRRCRNPVSRVKHGGRSHFLCEQCQV